MAKKLEVCKLRYYIHLEGFVMRRLVLLGFVCVCGLVFGQAAGGDAKAPVGPKLWIESRAIDLGVIAVDQQEIKGVVR